MQGESLGPAIDIRPGYENFWMYIPHFIHSPFYVYAYAFGDCLVNSLYAVYENASDGFAERYLAMLAAGGTKHYSELLKPFGLDAKDPKFWDGGLSVIAGMIDELEDDGLTGRPQPRNGFVMGADTISAAVAVHDDGGDRRGVPHDRHPDAAHRTWSGSLRGRFAAHDRWQRGPGPACPDARMSRRRRRHMPQTEGPYFKPSSPERIELFEEGMAGQPIELVGLVLSRACKPLAGALLDFWQADDKGRYDNSGFRLRGHQFTDAEGRYRLRSVVPGVYPGRTRHIHVKVQPRGGRVLTTQLYFPGEPKNRSDGLFRKDLLMRTAKNAGSLAGRFDFVVG